MRIECRLRIKYNITTKHSVIQHQRGNPNWPLWLKTHCSTGEKISNAEAAARVTSSNWNIYPQHQPLEHNRVGNPRFAIYTYTYIHTYIQTDRQTDTLYLIDMHTCLPTIPSFFPFSLYTHGQRQTNTHIFICTTLKFLNRLRSGALQPDSEANSRQSKGEVGCSASGSGSGNWKVQR